MNKLRDNREPLRLAPDRHSTGSRMDPALPLLPLPSAEVRSWFGEIDIYLFDQIIKGRFDHRRRVLDAGCGDGRNLIYFLRRGFTCFGVDQDPTAIEHVRELAATLSPRRASGQFRLRYWSCRLTQQRLFPSGQATRRRASSVRSQSIR